MAPRQLLLELEEVDMATDKGPKRVRVDRADESSTQSSGSGTGSECSKRHLRASQHPPRLSQQKLSTTTPLGVFQNPTRFWTHSLNSNPSLRRAAAR
eukprot:scaffold8148_cov241-Isochrysis_galbana.AAC.1